MNDTRSTNDVRLIALDVALQQAKVCQARRDNLRDKLETMAETVSANTTAISALTQATSALTTAARTTARTVDRNEIDIGDLEKSVTKLLGRPAIGALIGSAIGSGVPIVLGLLLWWMNK